jgi:hypothetical protein
MKLKSILATGIFLLSGVFVLQAQTEKPIVSEELIFGSSKGLIVVEAEHFYNQTLTGKRAWHINSPEHKPMVYPDHDAASYTDAGGLAYMEALPDLFHSDHDPIMQGDNLGSNGNLAVMHYKVWFAQPGRYYLWTRLRSNDQEDNTTQAGINGTWPITAQILQSPVEKKEWIWKSDNRLSRNPWKIGRACIDVPAAGVHDIQFCMREDGEEFDRFIFTTDSLYTITDGIGPEVTIYKGKLPKPWKSTKQVEPRKLSLINADGSFYGANVIYKDTLGMLAIEAENFYRQTLAQQRMWHLVTPNHTPLAGPDSDPVHLQGASENAYLELLPDGRQKDEDGINSKTSIYGEGGKAAVLSYFVSLEKTGPYYIWVRALAVDGDDNTLHVGIDNTWPESGKKLTFQGREWKWSNTQRDTKAPIYIEVSQPGKHEIMISMREDGCEIDRIFICSDKNFIPADEMKLHSIIQKGIIETWYNTREKRMNTKGNYLAENGTVIIEAESYPVTEGWLYKADTTKHSGLGYLEWTMEGQGIAAGKGVLDFSFEIQEAGNYQLFLRGKMADPTNRPETLDPDGNDVWVKFSGGNDVSKQQPLDDKWNKMAILGHPSDWTWNTNADAGKPHPVTPVCRYFEKGTHTITLSGRSKGYVLDKIAIMKFDRNPELSFDNDSLKALATAKESPKVYPVFNNNNQ